MDIGSRTAAPELVWPARSILIVDDEPGVRDVMKRWLEAGGYVVATAANAEEALGRIEASPPAVALCDISMPGHDGLWLAERIRQRCPATAVIMATGVPPEGPLPRPEDGVIDYLTKPFGRDRLRDAVLRGLEWHHSAWDARCWRQTLEQEMALRRQRLSAAVTALQIENDEALDAMLSMLMLHERDALLHADRVAGVCESIAADLGVSESDRSTIRQAGRLHDLGKLAIPEAIVRKPAPLTSEERSLMQMHPAIGSELLAEVPYLRAAGPLVRDLHERMDGQGYPRRVPAMETSLGARVVSVADAYDAMIHSRVFRAAVSRAEALAEIHRCSGTQFDPAVVASLGRIADS